MGTTSCRNQTLIAIVIVMVMVIDEHDDDLAFSIPKVSCCSSCSETHNDDDDVHVDDHGEDDS